MTFLSCYYFSESSFISFFSPVLFLKNVLIPHFILLSSLDVFSENVLFVSVHGYGPREEGMEHLMPGGAFYPGSGETTLPIIYPPKNGDDSQVLIEVSFNFTFNLY